MHCDETAILREQSGELRAGRRRRLRRHLAACPACAAYARDLARLEAEAPAALDIGDLGRETAARLAHTLPIPAAARPRPVLRWSPAMAAAALVLLALGAAQFLRPAPDPDPLARADPADAPSWLELEMDLLDLEVQVLRGQVGRWLPGENGASDLDDLADELLHWEETMG